MEHLPIYIYLIFAATTILAGWLFLKATNYSKPFMVILLPWIIVQSGVALTGFYSDPAAMTARFPLLIAPPLLFLITRLITQKGRAFLDSLNLRLLTLLQIVRVPVEITLFFLFAHQTVPEAMTFHGRNFDILSGISAPFIYYFGFVKKILSNKIIIAWNVLCLGLLLNVVSSAILSLPANFEQFGFEQPNIALGYFPFVLLPALLVPLVMLSTAAAIKQLIKK